MSFALAPQNQKRKPKPLKVSEADIEKTCTELLEWDGWRSLKTNPCSDRARGKGFGEVGMADVLYIRYRWRATWNPDAKEGPEVIAEVMWIEWKALDGKVSAAQHDWHVRERSRGALTLIAGEDFAASIEGFREWYAASGLQRRK